MADQTPVQIAWVTRDMDATERALSTLLGARKWVRMPGVHFGPETCRFRGRPADFVADVALSYAGDTQLEIITPVRGESLYTEFLDRCGPGLHHVCREAADEDAFEAAVRDAERHGATVVADGVMAGGMRFAYVADEDAGVPYIEIACLTEDIRKFFDYIKQEQQP
ncbi:VOC family protein [Mycolicibacterium baixiangningiae]|uniref:VOC family protein n=1 Tax=Mycolicibacterium baixiangningiae TaxID=2761578 RepID=UPI0018D12A53|nr:VOC family protein [Mycolicibacterium baixiangningiae]